MKTHSNYVHMYSKGQFSWHQHSIASVEVTLELTQVQLKCYLAYWSVFNPLIANDTFRRHKLFHLLEKGQFSQEEVQMCENHQVHTADFGEKIHDFSACPALKRTHGECTRGCPLLAAGFGGVAPRPHCCTCMASEWAQTAPICGFGQKPTPTHSYTPAVYFA